MISETDISTTSDFEVSVAAYEKMLVSIMRVDGEIGSTGKVIFQHTYAFFDKTQKSFLLDGSGKMIMVKETSTVDDDISIADAMNSHRELGARQDPDDQIQEISGAGQGVRASDEGRTAEEDFNILQGGTTPTQFEDSTPHESQASNKGGGAQSGNSDDQGQPAIEVTSDISDSSAASQSLPLRPAILDAAPGETGVTVFFRDEPEHIQTLLIVEKQEPFVLEIDQTGSASTPEHGVIETLVHPVSADRSGEQSNAADDQGQPAIEVATDVYDSSTASQSLPMRPVMFDAGEAVEQVTLVEDGVELPAAYIL